MRMLSCASSGRPRWYPPTPRMETGAPVRPSSRVCAFASGGILYLPFGTFPAGAPPACFSAFAAMANSPPNNPCRIPRRVAMDEARSCGPFASEGQGCTAQRSRGIHRYHGTVAGEHVLQPRSVRQTEELRLERSAVLDPDPADQPGNAQLADESEQAEQKAVKAARRPHVHQHVAGKAERRALSRPGGAHHVAHLRPELLDGPVGEHGPGPRHAAQLTSPRAPV